MLKLKEGDSLVYAGFCDDDDYIILFNGERNVLKLAIKDLTVASKSTIGVKSGFTQIAAAALVKDSDHLLFITNDNKGKLTPAKDFSVDSRGNKGQMIAESTVIMRRFDSERDAIYVIPKQGKAIAVSRDKVSIKSRTAIGAAVTTRAVSRII